MRFPELRRRLVDASFATFGEDAIWERVFPDQARIEGTAVTVRFREQDEDDRFGAVAIIQRSTVIKVRSWEVPQPAVGEMLEVLTGRYAGTYTIAAKPMLDKKGVWDCPADRRQA